MKKILAVILTLAFALGLTACGSGDGGSSDGEVSVFYYTYSDTYISSVRSAMDKLLEGRRAESSRTMTQTATRQPRPSRSQPQSPKARRSL